MAPSCVVGLWALDLFRLVCSLIGGELDSAVRGMAAGRGPRVLLSPAPSLQEWNRPVLLLAFPSSESEAVILKHGFWIVDQKVRPEVHADWASFISMLSGLVPGRPGHPGAVPAHRAQACVSHVSRALSGPLTLGPWVLWVCGEILSLRFSLVL